MIQREQGRILVRIESQVVDLAAAQQVTESKLQALIDALRRGSNGSGGEKQ